jgi:hypothetical protein
MKLEEKIIKKSIKHRNRAIKSRGTILYKKKLNWIKYPKIKLKKNPNFKKVQKLNKQ